MLLLFLLAGMGFISEKIYTVPKIDAPIQGTGYLHIHSLKKLKTSFSQGYVVQGTLRYFAEYYDIPVSLFYTKKELLPAADRDYIIEGTLSPDLRFKPKKGSLQAVPASFSFAEQRYRWKEKIKTVLKNHLTSKHAIAFLTPLTTGDSSDYILPILIGRLGLSHLFAISGLHFTCLLGFLSLFLAPFFRQRIQGFLLLLFATFYSFYLGSSPSLLRAFVSAMIFLVGLISYNKSNPLNTLGIALFFLSLFYPEMKKSVGFLLSFLATFSLIVFYPIMDGLLAKFLPSRCFTCFTHLSTLSKQTYLFLHVIKKCFAVNLAIAIGTLPLLLYYWHSFPLLSLLYNTFFPTLTLLALFGILVALALYALFPPLAPPIFFLVDYYTNTILHLVYYYPREWAFTLPCMLPGWVAILWIIGWVYLGLLTQKEVFD